MNRQWEDTGTSVLARHLVDRQLEPSRRRDFCHSAAPPSPFSRRFNSDGEGVSANDRILAAGDSRPTVAMPILSSSASMKPSRRRDCHFTDTPCLSLLKHILQVQGVPSNDSLAAGQPCR